MELALGKEIPKEVEMLSTECCYHFFGCQWIRRKFVEEELTRLRGGHPQEESEAEKTISIDDVLFELPNYLTKYHSRKTEDMLSNQMLCGIPEVDLGLEAKIKNIEETEIAKVKLLKEAMQKKKTVEETITARENILKDLAKGYVQHAIFDIDGAINSGTDLIKRLEGCGADEGISVSTSKFEVSDEYPPPPCPAPNWPLAATSLKPTDHECLSRFKEKFAKNN
ncbi:unnamed protein product [Soboliphyme baturini]|uniref:Retrotransposon protein, putative, unclassified n=1 Tax=Soboliphyme baturini TaxID=241478 RepID=A0A183J3V8_9BILA|nr:unnamed protein product [Soboliphyme baturini]